MKNSPLQLERYYLTELHYEANDALQLNAMPELTLESVVGIGRHNEDVRRFKVQLKVSFWPVTPDSIPQKGSVTFAGFFAVDPAYPVEKVPMLVETNAPSVLYGAAREMFCNLTARGPWGMVALPSQSFYKSAPKSVEPKAEATETNQSAPKS
jgi:preprotein translocase subunit SecB